MPKRPKRLRPSSTKNKRKRAQELEQKILSHGGLPAKRAGKKSGVYRVHPNSTASKIWGRTWWSSS